MKTNKKTLVTESQYIVVNAKNEPIKQFNKLKEARSHIKTLNPSQTGDKIQIYRQKSVVTLMNTFYTEKFYRVK